MTDPQRLDLDKVLEELQFHLFAAQAKLETLEKAYVSELIHNAFVRAKKQVAEADRTIDLVTQVLDANPLSDRFPVINRFYGDDE